MDVSVQFSDTENPREEDVNDCSDIVSDNKDINIWQKVALNTLSSEIFSCDECDAKFADEPELYYEPFWFYHRPNVTQNQVIMIMW